MVDKFKPAVNQAKWSALNEGSKDRWINDVQKSIPTIKILETTLSPVSVPASSTASEALTVSGVQSNDIIIGLQTSGGSLSASNEIGIHHMFISGTNSITIVFSNSSGGAVVPTSQLYSFAILRKQA